MHSIEELQKIIDQHIQEQYFPTSPEGLYEPISYFMQLGGKRIRPVLMLLALKLYDQDFNKHASTALALEFFHNFTLIHDDIMDNAPIRRGHATVHQQWNANTAILSGDSMLIKAYQLLEKAPKEYLSELLSLFNQTALEVCEGQQLDMNFEALNNVSIDEYLHMIKLKTAVLLGCALKMGTILANASKEDTENMYQFGVNLGIAFQLQDDLLDAFAPDNTFGKQKGGDIIANKKTFLLIKAFELATNVEADTLHHLTFEDHQLDDEQKVNTITHIFQQLEVPRITNQEIQRYAQAALQCLDKINVDASKKSSLTFLVNLLNQRVV